ncbi:MAG: zeta toxin family protein, partial [Leptospirales bacterium]
LNQEGVAVEAGRIMLDRMNTLAMGGSDFAFESTLASRSFTRIIRECKQRGYVFHLVYIWLGSVALAQQRVRARVAAGGHSIPPRTVARRYFRSLQNLFSLYIPLADSFLAFDNSTPVLRLVAERKVGEIEAGVFDRQTWRSMVILGESGAQGLS